MEYQSVTMWNNEIKEKLRRSLLVCKSDPNYIREVEYLLNKIDGMFIDMPADIADKIVPLSQILVSDRYYLNVHRSSADEEIKLLKGIGESLVLFEKIVRYEFKENEVKEEKVKDRLPNGIIDEKEIYGPGKAKRRFF